MQGASEQCMHATDIDLSPGTPSFSVTTRRRLTPHGTSLVFLHAVTQPLHSIQRSASHRNFILAMFASPPSGPTYAFTTWHTVVLVSCIIVTAS